MSRLSKVAMIREPGPIGSPAPLSLNCPCGAKPATTAPRNPATGWVPCQCGTIYTSDGWVIEYTTNPATGRHEP